MLVQNIVLSQLLAPSHLERVSIFFLIIRLGTLLNHVFKTDFTVMDPEGENKQTT
jgi:hypothetical protein